MPIKLPSRPGVSELADFFISYTAADLQYAEWIAWVLENKGYSCIIQSRDFVPSMDFMQQMRSAVRRARQVIAVLSEDYFLSKYATSELNAALAEDPLGETGRLVPVRVRECSPNELMR